jgi:hypothetical protein
MLKKLLPTCAPMLGEEDYLPNLSVSRMTYALPIWHDYMTAKPFQRARRPAPPRGRIGHIFFFSFFHNLFST